MAAAFFSVTAPALAVSDYMWAPKEATSPWWFWSVGGNWSSGAAPAGLVGTLTFPATAGCVGCATENDASGLAVNRLVVTGDDYRLSGDGFSLGPGGVAISSGASFSSMAPVSLDTDQRWTIDGRGAALPGGGLWLSGGLAGNGHALTATLGSGGGLYLAGDVELGPVSVSGADPSKSGGNADQNGGIGSEHGINALSGNPVTVSNVSAGGGQFGPLSSHGADLAAPLVVSGALTLDGATELRLGAPVGTVSSSDAPVTATGPVSLAGAELTLWGGYHCQVSPPGVTFTIISSATSLTGQFGGIPDGALITAGQCGGYQSPTYRVHYTATTVTATTVGSAVHSTKTSILYVRPQAPGGGDPVELAGLVEPGDSTPPITMTGTLTFHDNGRPIEGCTGLPVTGLQVPIICQTTFSQPGSRHVISATFTPTDPTTWQASTSPSPPTVDVQAPPSQNAPGSGSSTQTAGNTGTNPTATTPVLTETATITGLIHRLPLLALRFRADHGSKPIQRIEVRFPSGILVNRDARRLAHGISVSSDRHPNLGVHHGVLIVSLRKATSRTIITIGPSALVESRALARAIGRNHHQLKLQLRLRVNRGTSTALALNIR